jgi:site-specific DNA recombinase
MKTEIPKTEDMLLKQAVAYIRVSSIEQVENYSLDNQLKDIQREAERRGYAIVEVFREEGKSAKTAKRPKLIELLEYCRLHKREIQAVFVYKIDRLSRNTMDYLIIRKKLADFGIDFISATETTGKEPHEELLETVLAGFATFDNRVRAVRATVGLKSRFLEGWKIGKPPLGYKSGKIGDKEIIENDPKTFNLMKKAWTLMATGTKTLAEMRDLMDGWGLKAFYKGKHYPLRTQTVSRLFKNKFYMGILSSEKYREEIRGKHNAMIDEATYYKVQAIILGRNVNEPGYRYNRDNEIFLLRRIVRCTCGMGYTGGMTKYGKFGYYHCPKRCEDFKSRPYGKRNIATDELEKAVIALLRTVQPTQGALDYFTYILRKKYYSKIEVFKKRKKVAEEEIVKLHDLRVDLAEKNVAGTIVDEVYKELDAKYESRMIAAQVVKNDSILDQYNIEAIVAFIKNILSDLGKAYLLANLEQKRALLSSIFPLGIIYQKNGISNQQISPTYQAIRDQEVLNNALGAGEGSRTPCVHFGKVTFYR